MSDFMNKATEVAADLKVKATELADKLPDSVKDMVGQAKGKATEVMDKLPDSVKEKVEMVKDKVEGFIPGDKDADGK
jgi:uncharacterized protein YjbJ (UPF0337 family)